MSKICIVSGGFDPVHSGHINLMLAARELSDELVVLLNSDEWLSRKKGRPFMNFFERKMVLENMWFVDKVLDFDDSDNSAVNGLEKVVKMYKPKDDLYFCNGGDRNSLNDIPEKGVAGIQLKFGVGGDTKINSSSKLVNEYFSRPAERDWGNWDVLKNYEHLGVKVKELIIKPGQSTSMQRHRYRSEFMFVADGELTNMDRVTEKHNYTMIDQGEWHKLENKGKKDLHIVEIQYGTACVEEDIERRN
jgi:D-beta-D-heptose 7-phosphate kinase/D-beta-D-heptose 1-phosphate adenosyltransferase